MKNIDISKGIPRSQFIQLLQKGEPFQLTGTEVLVFEKQQIKRFNKERLTQFLAQNTTVEGIDPQLDLSDITHIKGIELTKYDKQLLLAGKAISVGHHQVKLEDGKLHVESLGRNLDGRGRRW